MITEEAIQQSETHVFKVVFPDTTNHHNTMFGGRVIMMMTETAFITATRFSRKTFVIVNAGKIDFKKPIPAGTIIELIGRVVSTGNTSLNIRVDIYIEQMYSFGRENAVSGEFTLVALNKDNKPTKI
jgi:acyl-CoA hydrolase